jgi:hypothetical protein
MTREEAIEFGKMWLELQEDCKESNTYEFFKMAIEALQQEPCEDVVSRSEIKKIAKEMYLEVANMELDAKTISDCISCASSKCREVLESKLKALPSVKTQEPKKGNWIMTGDYFTGAYESIDYVKCSCCGEESLEEGNYCPNCGANMREVQE